MVRWLRLVPLPTDRTLAPAGLIVTPSASHLMHDSLFFFLEKIATGRVAIAHHGPGGVLKGWSRQPPDDWGENCALTR
jgi:hypothetical protein